MPNRFRNTYQTYGWAAIVLHWLSVPLVLFLLVEGMYMVTLTYYDPLYHTLPEWHKWAGVALFIVTIVRLFWAAVNKSPFVLTISYLQRAAAHGAHILIYCLLLVMGITGYLVTTAEGQPISLFAGLNIPAITTISPDLSLTLGDIHRWSAYSLAFIIVLHVSAALLHHFFYRDQTLTRMFKPLD